MHVQIWCVCAADCRAGHYYPDINQVSCQQCKRGYYQDKPWQDSCVKCPPSTTTVSDGSKSKADCMRKCTRGHAHTHTHPHTHTNTHTRARARSIYLYLVAPTHCFEVTRMIISSGNTPIVMFITLFNSSC